MVALIDAVQNIGNAAFDGFRRNAVLEIVRALLLAPAVGFGDGAGHRAGDFVGIEDHPSIDIARRAANGLDQRGFGTQEAFLVGIENGHECAFWNIKTLAQKIDADEDVKRAEPQITNDFNPFNRVDIRVHVADADAVFVQIFGEIFRHALGQYSDERAISLQRHGADLAEQIIHLCTGGADIDFGVDQSCRPDDLFDEDAAGAFHFPIPGRGRDMHRLRPHRFPFLEPERAVIEAGGQAEAVFCKRRLPFEVAAIHAADLRNGDMAFIRENESIIGQIFEQSWRRLARFAAREIARVILDPLADACCLQHFKIKQSALLKPLCLEQTTHADELVQPTLQFIFDALDRLKQGRTRRHIMRVRVDFDGFKIGGLVAGERIKFDNRLDLVPEHRNAPAAIFIMGRKQLDNIATDPERASDEIAQRAFILQGNEIGDQLPVRHAFANGDRECHGGVGFD